MAATDYHEMLVVPGDQDHQRSSEADIIELTDGRLLLAWSDFYAGQGEDWSPSRLSAKTSSDGGVTWSDAFVLLENEATQSTMEVDFKRLGSGDIALFYCRKNGDDDCRVLMRKSGDDGQTWSDPTRLTDWHGYCGLTNNRSILTSTGRIVLPFWYAINQCFVKPAYGVCQAFISDDEGETWTLSRPPLGAPDSQGGTSEPAVAELSDGRLMMMMRNTSGRIWASMSDDGGYLWEPPQPTDLAASTSPISLNRVPGGTDLLLIWNQASKKEIDWGLTRHRLSCAISKDDGRTWQHFKYLESLDDQRRLEPAPVGDPPQSHRPFWEAPLVPSGPLNCSYPSCTFVGDNAVITYDFPADHCALKLRVLPIAWFYDDDAPNFRSTSTAQAAAVMPRAVADLGQNNA